MSLPLVTIAVPTYNRPELLKRALTCVANQDYENIEVLVADNCTPGTLVEDVVESFKNKVQYLTFTKHPVNIGAFKNFCSLLDAANGEYFMWLADDDEISSNYVSSLIDLMENNPDAASAVGRWILMVDENSGKNMVASNFPQKSVFARVIRFVWKSDDAFFYGLHNTAVIKKAKFPGYYWPNNNVLLNWAYVYLLDMVLHGPILLTNDPSVCFINHDYTAKNYGERKSKLIEVFKFALRRFNVHYLYFVKIRKSLNAMPLFVVFLVSATALCRELLIYFIDNGVKSFRKMFSSNIVHR